MGSARIRVVTGTLVRALVSVMATSYLGAKRLNNQPACGPDVAGRRLADTGSWDQRHRCICAGRIGDSQLR